MTFKYRPWVTVLTLVVASCAAPPPPVPNTPSTTPSAATATAATATGSPAPSATGLATPIPAHIAPDRRWYTVPNGLEQTAVSVLVAFDDFPGEGQPFVSIEGGPEVRLTRAGSNWVASVPLSGVAPGERRISVFERLRTCAGCVANVATATIMVTQPEYVVWTLDFEGDAASEETMLNTGAIADAFKVPMTILWNPRAWVSPQVSLPQANAMFAWTNARAAVGDEVGLHLHMWTDYVRSASVIPHTQPNWAGRLDGYDVPLTSYSEAEQARLIEYGLRLMNEHGLTGITSFRAGGDFGDAATLRALVANGITADCTAVPAGTFGSLRWPWTLPADAQPYRPSRDDANKSGDLPILEAPTNAGNTYAYTTISIAPIVRADLAMLARPGEVATARKGLTIVSHPGTIDPSERAAIESLFHAFDVLRYDHDTGPVRFVTLKQLAQAWR